MSPIERLCIAAEPMGLPSPEALQLATNVVRQRYLLAETIEHPEVRSECMRLAYLIMAYGLASRPSAGWMARLDSRASRFCQPATAVAAPKCSWISGTAPHP
jgi:hypothetical protein